MRNDERLITLINVLPQFDGTLARISTIVTKGDTVIEGCNLLLRSSKESVDLPHISQKHRARRYRLNVCPSAIESLARRAGAVPIGI
jgi:hypothetical protein